MLLADRLWWSNGSAMGLWSSWSILSEFCRRYVPWGWAGSV